MLHADLMALCFIEAESPIAVLHCGNSPRIYDRFSPCDRDFDPMTFIKYTNLTSITWRYTGRAKIRQCVQSYQYYIQPTNACTQLRMMTFGHVTKMAVTPFDKPYSETICCTQTSGLYMFLPRCDENSVCLSVKTRGLWQNRRKFWPDFYTIWKII